MSQELAVLVTAAFSLGFLHVLFGPDHYIPFIVMSRARGWSRAKTVLITVLCGIGHVGSSVIVGLLGIWLGIHVSKLEAFESLRGGWAAWSLIAFGAVYLIYGLRKIAERKMKIKAVNFENLREPALLSQYVPWSLFLIFVFGPCEPLIPIFMYPAVQHNLFAMVLATAIFSLTTILTMVGIVWASVFGLQFLPVRKFENYSHALAGVSIFLCGLAVQFLGL